MTTALLAVTAVTVPVCPSCGQPLPPVQVQSPEVIRVVPETVANIYDVWPVLRGNAAGPKILVIEVKGS